ncbi:MAG: class I adenylate-forming enzyme family protein [Novosphingobium sp.]|nr:class I adenylate-forming enzyme family protein [Novosphingobium sp.]
MSDAAAELAELRKQTIWEMLQASAARVPDRAALVALDDDGSERRLSYAELVDSASEFSAGLAHIGVRRGDRVVLWMTNSLEWVIACLAAMRIGAAVVPINTFLKPDEIDYLIRQSGARHIVMIDAFRKLDMPAILGKLCPAFAASKRPGHLAGPEFPDLRNVVLLSCRGGTHPGTFDFRSLQELGRSNPEAIALADEMAAATTGSDLGFVKYTSGSTSFPKGVMLQQGGIVANGMLHSRRIGVIDGEIFFSMMPFFHGGGSIWGLMTMLTRGGTLVFTEAFTATRAAELIDQEQATILFGALPNEIYDAAREKGLTLSSLRIATITCEADREIVPNASWFIMPSGLTEAYGPMAVNCGEDPPEKFGKCGRMLDGYELRLVDPATGKDVATGEVGEAWVRGNVMLGYWNKPDETARAFTQDGWLKSEDLMSRDEDGYISYVGRIKLMLKVGGENVSIEEVEALIDRHEEVAISAAVGVPDERKGERMRAYVELRRGAKLTETELHDWLSTRLARFKQPREILFVDAMPRLANSKLDRVTLGEMATQEVETA